jgi:uncharacterized protein YoxC
LVLHKVLIGTDEDVKEVLEELKQALEMVDKDFKALMEEESKVMQAKAR